MSLMNTKKCVKISLGKLLKCVINMPKISDKIFFLYKVEKTLKTIKKFPNKKTTNKTK